MAATETLQHLDIVVLHELVGDDPATVAGLLATFVESVESSAKSLRGAIAVHDAPGVRAAAHRIKSPALLVGALPFGRLCEALEQAAGDDDWSALQRIFGGFECARAAAVAAAAAHVERASAP